VLAYQGHQARQPGHGGQFGHADAQAPLHHLGLAELFHRRIAFAQQLARQHEHLFPFLGQPGGALAAVEERGVERLLQLVHALGDGRLRGVQLAGRGREAAQLADPVEGFQLFEGHHGGGLSIAFLHAIRAQKIAF